jgi:hypothetical protein
LFVLFFSAPQQKNIGLGLGLPAHHQIAFKQTAVEIQYKLNESTISDLNKALRIAANTQMSEAERLVRLEHLVSQALVRVVDRQETLLIASTHDKGWQLVSAMEKQQQLSGLRPVKQKALTSAYKTVGASSKPGREGSASFGAGPSTSREADAPFPLFRGFGQYPMQQRGFGSGQSQFVDQRQQRADEINRRYCNKCGKRGHYPGRCPRLYSRSDPNGVSGSQGGRPSM